MTQPAPAPLLDTDEQLSGRAADAVADMHNELQRRYSGLNSAEVQLAEALLAAHATTDTGRRRLQAIQRQVVEAINNPVNALDTPAGERQFLIFLRSKVAEIQQIVDGGTLTALDQAELTRTLAGGYLSDDPATGPPSTRQDGPTPIGPQPSELTPSAPMPTGSSAAMPQPAIGAPPAGMPAMPQSLGGLPQAASPLAGLGSLLGSGDTATDEDQQGKISRADADTDEDDDDDDAVDDEPPATPDDAAPDNPGPAVTRPAAG